MARWRASWMRPHECNFTEFENNSLAIWQGGGNWCPGNAFQTIRVATINAMLARGVTVLGVPQSFCGMQSKLQKAPQKAQDAKTLRPAVENAVLRGGRAGRPAPLILCWRQYNSFAQAHKPYSFAEHRLVPDVAFAAGALCTAAGMRRRTIQA